MEGLFEKVAEAAAVIRAKWPQRPHAGIILGTGLGELADEIASPVLLDYETIPHFLRSTAISHRGRLVCGELAGMPVVAMEGRFHQYEGYDLQQITLPVRVFKALGADLLIVSQAVGGMNPYFRVGDVMIIDDHINLMGDNPLIGINDERLGPRFPDMSAPYTPELIEAGLAVARRENFAAHRGVSVAVTGPNLETRAEYRFLRGIGADVVGMSTVPEVIVAVHSAMRVFGMAVITDLCLPDALQEARVEEIIRAANAAGPKLAALARGVLEYERDRSGRLDATAEGRRC